MFILVSTLTVGSLLAFAQQQEEGCRNISQVFTTSDGQSCQAMECFLQNIIICLIEEEEDQDEGKETKDGANENKKPRVISSLPFELPDHAFVLNPFEEEEEDARIVWIGTFHSQSPKSDQTKSFDRYLRIHGLGTCLAHECNS